MSNTNMCYRFLAGRCPFSNLTCPFSHSKDNVPLCRYEAFSFLSHSLLFKVVSGIGEMDNASV